MADIEFCSTGVRRVQDFMVSRLVKGALKGLAAVGFSERAQERVHVDVHNEIQEALEDVTDTVLEKIYDEVKQQGVGEREREAAYENGYESGSESGYNQGVEDTEREHRTALDLLSAFEDTLPRAEQRPGCSAFLLRVTDDPEGDVYPLPCPVCTGNLALRETTVLCSACRTEFTLQPR